MKKPILFSAFLICLSLTLGCSGTTSDAQPASSNVNVSAKETEKPAVASQNKTESLLATKEVTPVPANDAISEDLSKYLDRTCAKDISKELENPIAMFTKSAEAGNMKAQHILAECYYHGEGIKEDFEKAVFWYQKSASQDYWCAQDMLASCYANGKGVQKNNEEAIKWLEKAAKQNFVKAQINLASLFFTVKRYKEALSWLEKAVAQNSEEAILSLGSFYLKEETGYQDFSKAAVWLEKAAEMGNMMAMQRLALLYVEGKGVPKDLEKPLKALNPAVEKDDSESLTILSAIPRWLYARGEDVAKNKGKDLELHLEKALKILKPAVEKGDSESLTILFQIARKYALGDDVAKNKEKSIELLDILSSKSVGIQKDLLYANKLILSGKFEAAHIAFQKAIQQFESAPFSQPVSPEHFSVMLSGYRLLYFWYLVSFAEGYSPESKNYDYICLGDENIQSTLNFFAVSIDDFKMNRNSKFYEFGKYLKEAHEIIAKHFSNIVKPHMNCPLWSDKERPVIDWAKLSEDFKNFLSKQYFRSENVEWSAVIMLYQKLQTDFQASQQKLLSIIDRERLSSSSSITIDQSLEYVKYIEAARLWVSLNDKALRFYLFDTPVLFFTTMSMGPVDHAVGPFNYFNDTDSIMAVAKPFSVLTTPALPYTSENYVRELWFKAAKDIKQSLSENDYKELQNLTTKVLPAINLPENYKFNWP